MNITQDTAVTLNYKIHEILQGGIAGSLLDKGDVAYLHGGYQNIFEKVEAALQGKAVGDSLTVDMSVEEGFGPRDESLMRNIPKGEFPAGVKVGGQLRGSNDQGLPQIYNVVKIKGPVVILDGNHPLAGKALRFSAKVVEVRAASEEEVAHKHVHGGHGHHH
ncbi:MAG: peptidylprolyl isomerase [Comamonas sp.]|nr:peptidylprolyl isomerase [Candidatus Comamonas equi]